MGKNIFAVTMTALLLIGASNAQAVAPQTLQWRDLLNHPERWPATTTVKNDLQFSQSTMDKGTEVQVYNVLPREVELIAPEGFIFTQTADQCTLVEDANAFWSALTEDQKEVTWQKIVSDRSLWPGKITLPSGARFQGLTLEPGEEALFMKAEGNSVFFTHPKSDMLLSANQNETDVFERARALAAIPKEERPSFLQTVFDGNLIDAQGQIKPAKKADYYIIYYAASTCPRCKIFSPKFVEYYNQNLADRDDVEIIVWSTEQPKTSILPYMREHHMPWATVDDKKALATGNAFRNAGVVTQIPAIIVTDKYGNEILASRTAPAQTIAKDEQALMQLPSVIGQ